MPRWHLRSLSQNSPQERGRHYSAKAHQVSDCTGDLAGYFIFNNKVLSQEEGITSLQGLQSILVLGVYRAHTIEMVKINNTI